MKTNRKQARRLLLSFFVVLQPLLASAQSTCMPNYEMKIGVEGQEIEEGTCGAADGDNLKWTFYPETGTLEIVGYGAMADFGAHRTPWSHLEQSISKVNLSSNITRVGDYAFFCCNLSTIDLPDDLESIGYSAFDYTPWMAGQSHGPVYLDNWLIAYLGDMSSATLAIEEGTIGVADHAIYKENLKKVVFPKGLKYIGDASFSSQPNLTSISFSEGLLSIGDNAFACCNKLLNVTLPEGIEEIGFGAFFQCEILESVVFPGSLSSTGVSSFASCPKLINVQLGEGICRIDVGSFQDCTSLVEITLPSSLTSIGQAAFSGCSSMTEIILPANIEGVEIAAFYGCPQLTKVISMNRIPPTITDWSVFDVLTYDIDLYVPCRTYKDYKSRWKGFASIVELECECEKFEITFMVNGEVIAVKELPHDSTVELPEVEYKVGYTFEWLDIPSKMPAEDLVVYGRYTPNCYLVTFKIGDEVIASDSLEYGSAIVAPDAPEREGYTFNGWGDVAKTVPASDVTYEGTYSVNSYTITYSVDGELVHSESVTYGAVITALDDPIKEGHTFSGWNGLPETMPAKDITVNGTFTVNQYQVTFKIDGVVIASYTQDYGSAIVVPDAPEREGYTFNGWGDVAETVPAADVIYEGTYTVNYYTLNYEVDGEVVYSESVTYGTTIIALEEPTKEGHTFSGWGEVPVTMPAKDVTITGTFTVNKYLVTFKIGDEVIASDSLEYGATIVAPEEPEKEGHTFNGWGEVAETVPACDVTYEGTYTVNIYKVYYYVGEELVHTAEVAYGEPIPEYIYEPEEEGYTFLGWVGETYATMPAHDVTYTANIDNGIGQLTNDKGQLTIYDLAGRKVTDTENQKGGIYIINGRKVVNN